MECSISYSTVMDVVEEIVSREAGQAYTAEGGSLYDAIRIVSRDEAAMKRLMADALVLIQENCNRFLEAKDAVPEGTEDAFIEFELNLSERRSSGKEKSITTLLQDIAVNFVVNRFFVSKNQQELAAKYHALAEADVQTLTRLLYTKNPPKYPTTTEDNGKDGNNNPS